MSLDPCPTGEGISYNDFDERFTCGICRELVGAPGRKGGSILPAGLQCLEKSQGSFPVACAMALGLLVERMVPGSAGKAELH